MYNEQNESETYEQKYESVPNLPPSEWYGPLSQKDKAKYEIWRWYVYIDKYSATSTNYVTPWPWWNSVDHLVTLPLIKWSLKRLQSYTDTEIVILATGWYHVQFSVSPTFADNAQACSPFVQLTHLDASTEIICWCEIATFPTTALFTWILDSSSLSCQSIAYLQKGEKIEVYVRVRNSTAFATSWKIIFDSRERLRPHLTLHKLS